MEYAPVSKKLKITYPENVLSPGEITESFLSDNGLIDGNWTSIQSFKRIGGSGTFFKMRGDVSGELEEDEITISPDHILINSSTFPRLQQILDAFKTNFGSTIILKGEFSVDDHYDGYDDENYVDSIFNPIVKSDDFRINYLRVENKPVNISLYNCHGNCIHVHVEVLANLNKPLSGISLENDFKLERFKSTYDSFKVKYNLTQE